jgi:tRNA pseudouridine55 synthase
LNGLLILDKPAGMTSHDVVAIVRRATGERSIGHLGTLDPMATGVLPLLLGKYTRLAQFFGQAEKHYTGNDSLRLRDGHLRCGRRTAAGESQPLTKSLAELRELALHTFHGESTRCRRCFSAKKINGVPAHKLARAGKGCSGEACAHHHSQL